MSIEKGTIESEPEEGEGDLVLDALKSKLEELRRFSTGLATEKISIKQYEEWIDKINEGDQDAYNKAAKEFGSEDVPMGEQKLRSKKMKIKKISPERRKEIDEALDRFN